MKYLIPAILLASSLILAQAETVIIPVSVWPKVLNFPDKQIVNASVSDCVKAGYRLIPTKPVTPAGKQIKSEKFVQDDVDQSKCKYEIIYEDVPPPPAPEVLTNIPAARVQYQFTTNGVYRAAIWLDAPKSNAVIEAE